MSIPSTEVPVSVWTAAEESRLSELLERKERIMLENSTKLIAALNGLDLMEIHYTKDLADALIPLAGKLREALLPFDLSAERRKG